ncbi:MAG: glucose-6-phosphate isomerase family protein [Propioniciclava sp.]
MALDVEAGIGISLPDDRLAVTFSSGVVHPTPVVRTLSEVRASLASRTATGPEELYAIYMDVAEAADEPALVRQNLLFGIVRYAAGALGDEPVRSQGHVHAISASCGTSTPELYEFWEGLGAVYLQERVADDPGRCFAVHASPGDIVLVPPGWAHLTVNAGHHRRMTFGAWCVRDYGFDYTGIRERRGLAWYPKVDGEAISWVPNPHYRSARLEQKAPRAYAEFAIGTEPIYRQWQTDPDRMDFIARPGAADPRWHDFVP